MEKDEVVAPETPGMKDEATAETSVVEEVAAETVVNKVNTVEDKDVVGEKRSLEEEENTTGEEMDESPAKKEKAAEIEDDEEKA